MHAHRLAGEGQCHLLAGLPAIEPLHGLGDPDGWQLFIERKPHTAYQR